MSTVIKADAGHDFLALLPRLTGYQPENSVVLVAFRGNRTCGAIRFDLPEAASLTVMRRLATSMIGMLCRIPDVDAVVPVAYTDEVFDGGAEIPQATFLDVLVHRAEVSGFLVRDALCVAADGWASYLDPETPAGGRPLGAIAASPVNALADAEGMAVRSGVAADTTLPAVGLVRSERVARRLRLLREDPLAAGPTSAGAEDLVDLALPEFLEQVLAGAPEDLADDVVASLLWVIERPIFRDVALVQWAFGLETGLVALDEQIRYHLDSALDETGTGLLLWGEGPRPHADRIERAIEVLRAVAAAAPRSARVAPLTMLGWLSWALGQSSRAAVFVGDALAIDAEYGLACLVGAMVDGGRLPEWAFEVPAIDDAAVPSADAPPAA